VLVVSDTTALTTLLKAGEEDLLQRLFGNVCIPVAVARELRRFHKHLPDFLQVREIADRSRLPQLQMEVDDGEAEVIGLALELGADVVLMDDRKGRREAEKAGLHCLGLPAVLLAAKRQGLVASLDLLLRRLETRCHFRLKDSVRARLLLEAAE
jgi:predicted nucleic acid-binding protein